MLFTLDVETLLVGMIFPLVLIPSLSLYLVFDYYKNNNRYKDFLFWIPVVVMVACSLAASILECYDLLFSEVGGHVYLYTAVILSLVALVEYFSLKKIKCC